jgi:hypothetical protein
VGGGRHVEKSTLDLAGHELDLCMGISSLKFENSVNPHFWHIDIDFGVLMYCTKTQLKISACSCQNPKVVTQFK